MKIVIVGTWKHRIYEQAFADSLTRHGHTAVPFSTLSFFSDNYLGKLQAVLPVPLNSILRLNHALMLFVEQQSPDYVLFWRPTHILPSTVISINSLGVKTVSYFNDDPYGPLVLNHLPWHHYFLWFWSRKCIPLFTITFFYRSINQFEALKYSGTSASLLYPYFIPAKDKPLTLTPHDIAQFSCDVVFVGHYEPDGRDHQLQCILSSGISLKIWGGKYWHQSCLAGSPVLHGLKIVEDTDYIKALSGAKICLSFLSKINRDKYTRRCFEIPACRQLLLCERSVELTSIFQENVEACFFSSTSELLDKIHWLLKNPQLRLKIAEAGYNRVWKDRHDIDSRVSTFIKTLESC